MITHLRTIAHHEARQLRTYPVRLWPYVKQERDAAVLLLAAHGRHIPCAPMVLNPRTRLT